MIPLTIGLICFLMAVFLAYGAGRRWPRTTAQPPVTVVVCARNEEEHLLDCLMSLSTQDYPADKYSLLLVNHLSTDETGEMMEYFATYSPVSTRVLHIHEEDPLLKGKIHALEAALQLVETEYVLLTDADCIVPESWVATMISYFGEEVMGVSGLVTVGRHGYQDTAVAHMQHVDHRYYLGMLAGLAGLRAPTRRSLIVKKRLPGLLRRFLAQFRPAFCIGNNLAFRMSLYRKLGGYRAIGPSLIEDYALMNAMARVTDRHLVVVLDPGARVITTPEKSMRKLWRQKRRWSTGTSVINPLSVILFVMIILIRVVVPFFIFTHPIQTIAALLLMAVGDLLVIRRVSRRTGDRIRIREILLHEVYQIVLNILLVLGILVRWPVFWKGQRYSNPSGR